MNQKTFVIIISGIVAFVLLVFLVIQVAVEPWAEKKVQNKFNDNVHGYLLDIGKLNISIIKRGVSLKNITLVSTQEKEGVPVLEGEIASVKIRGVKLLKALFRQDIEIGEVSFTGSRITGEFPFPEKSASAKVSPLNITIHSLILDNFSIDIKSDTTPQVYMIRDGFIYFQSLKVEKSDTLTAAILKQFDFGAKELKSVSSDSMYTFTAWGLNYSGDSNTLSASHFAIQPNYSDDEFAARHPFESDRVEAELCQVAFHDFSVGDYIKSGNLTSSYIETGVIEMRIFRDKREEFRHVNRPTFQELVYSYHGSIEIDSIGILNGSITYAEHAEKANEPGMVRFDELKVMIYNVSNDPVYKTHDMYYTIQAEALLMGAGKANVFLKGRLFEKDNTFEAYGTLSSMEAKEMNPILEKNAFVYVTSGYVETMNFNFTADNSRATGNMEFIYNGLHLAVKNKRTDDTTAVGEQFMSMVANMKVMDSNPLPGEDVRIGIIDYERDPEKFLFNYFVKSIMSGVTSSLANDPKNKEE